MGQDSHILWKSNLHVFKQYIVVECRVINISKSMNIQYGLVCHPHSCHHYDNKHHRHPCYLHFHHCHRGLMIIVVITYINYDI